MCIGVLCPVWATGPARAAGASVCPQPAGLEHRAQHGTAPNCQESGTDCERTEEVKSRSQCCCCGVFAIIIIIPYTCDCGHTVTRLVPSLSLSPLAAQLTPN